MRKSRDSAGDEDPRAEESDAPQEPDLSVPDLEIEADRGAHSERPSTGDPRASPRFGKGQWFALWLAITLGVAAGHLLSNGLTSLAVAYQVRGVVSDLAAGLDEASREAEKADERGRAEAREQRKAGERAQSLARQCEDWRAAHRELDTEITKKNMDKYCSAYREYVDTGRVSIE